MAWKGYLGSLHFQFIKIWSKKYKGVDWKIVMVWQGLVPIGHKFIFLSIINIWKWLWLLWVLIIILNNLYLQSICFGTRSFFKIVKVPQGMFLNLGARVLNSKGVYLAHLLVFLSDSKDMLLFKELSTNHFKFFKKFYVEDA